MSTDIVAKLWNLYNVLRDDGVTYHQYVTELTWLLLTAVALRLNGRGGDQVVQLQTSFGGGKTHTLLAVYHLATRTQALSELSGVSAWLDRAVSPATRRAAAALLVARGEWQP